MSELVNSYLNHIAERLGFMEITKSLLSDDAFKRYVQYNERM
jgi:hypothetical protein